MKGEGSAAADVAMKTKEECLDQAGFDSFHQVISWSETGQVDKCSDLTAADYSGTIRPDLVLQTQTVQKGSQILLWSKGIEANLNLSK